jgi:hypothetical protein
LAGVIPQKFALPYPARPGRVKPPCLKDL